MSGRRGQLGCVVSPNVVHYLVGRIGAVAATPVERQHVGYGLPSWAHCGLALGWVACQWSARASMTLDMLGRGLPSAPSWARMALTLVATSGSTRILVSA